MTQHITHIDVSQISEHKLLAIDALRDLGCSSQGCTSQEITHIALERLTLESGKTLHVTRPYCRLCALAVQASAKA